MQFFDTETALVNGQLRYGSEPLRSKQKKGKSGGSIRIDTFVSAGNLLYFCRFLLYICKDFIVSESEKNYKSRLGENCFNWFRLSLEVVMFSFS